MFDPSALKEECVLFVKFVSDEMWAWCQRLGFDGHLFVIHDGVIDLVDTKTSRRNTLENPESRTRDPRGLLQFTLWVGSPGDSRIDPGRYMGVCARVGAKFDNFTVESAEACSRSRFEDALLIHIKTREPRKAIELADDLRCFLGLQSVGVSHNGVYQHVRDWSDLEMLLEAFNHR